MISYNPLTWKGVGVGQLKLIIIFKIFLTGFGFIKVAQCNYYINYNHLFIFYLTC
jgi:hypothetical protein